MSVVMDRGRPDVKLGLRVVRGPDWMYGDDNPEGLVGTVVEIGGQNGSTAPAKSVAVVWDTGVKGSYRTGYEDSYDLDAFDNIQCGVFHFRTCNGCGVYGITGFKWTCASCYSVSLCTACYMSDRHDILDPFIRCETYLSYGIGVPPRFECQNDKQLAKGIFQGALVVRGLNWNADNQDGGDGNPGQVVKVSKWGEYTVRWTTGASYTYRMGRNGAVDLKLAGPRFGGYYNPGFGGYYYKSHLPVVGYDGNAGAIARRGHDGTFPYHGQVSLQSRNGSNMNLDIRFSGNVDLTFSERPQYIFTFLALGNYNCKEPHLHKKSYLHRDTY